MGLAETVQLGVDLKLGTSGSFKTATSELAAVESVAGRGTGGLTKLSGSLNSASATAGKFGGAISHARGALGSFLTGPLGVLGVGGGIAGLGLTLDKIIEHTNDFAFSVEKLTGLTGGSAESMSTLLAVFEKFNISAERTGQIVGFAEKTLGNLAKTSSSAGKSAGDLAKDQEKVVRAHQRLELATLNLQKVEGNGKHTAAQYEGALYKVRNATVDLRAAESQLAADRQNKGATSVSKLIELDKEYGLHLIDTKGKLVDFDEELKQVADVYTSSLDPAKKAALAAQLFGRGYADLVPILALGRAGINDAEQAAKDLGLTLTSQNAKDLKDYREALRETGDAIGGLELQIGLRLVPVIKDMAVEITSFLKNGGRDTIVGFFDKAVTAGRAFVGVIKDDVIPVIAGIKGAWDSIPQGFRDLITTGLVANKTVKFLFGFSPITFATDALKTTLGIGVKQGLIEAGLGKLFVQPVFVTNPGFGGGLPGLPAAGAGAAEEGFLASFLAAGFIPVALTAASIAAIGAAFIFSINQKPDWAPGHQFDRGHGYGPPGTHGGSADSSGFANANDREDRALTAVTEIAGKIADDRVNLPMLLRAVSLEWKNAIDRLAHPKSQSDLVSAFRETTKLLTSGRGSAKETVHAIDEMKKQLGHIHDPKLHAEFAEKLRKIEGLLPGRQFAARELENAKKILASHESGNKKIKDLEAIERALKDHGLPHAASVIAKEVDKAKRAIAEKQRLTTEAIKDKDLSVTTNVTVPVTTYVNGWAIKNITTRLSKWGVASSAGPGKG